MAVDLETGDIPPPGHPPDSESMSHNAFHMTN